MVQGDAMQKLEYKPLTLPEVKWAKKVLSETSAELVAQPLEPGFGHTLGNALRRVLLSSVEGSAVVAVKIKGVNNEFSTISGVVEDVLQLVLNVKQIVIRNKTGKSGHMSLKVSGPSVARVSDIVADEHLELVNKDHVVANVAAGGSLDIEFFVEAGRGYQPANWPSVALQEDGRIFIDAMFCPVTKVAFDVEKTRVGSDIDYDKLTIKLYTNGAENPVDVMHYAVSVLRTQLQHFLHASEIPFNEISRLPDVAQEGTQQVQADDKVGYPVALLLKPIEELDLSVRAHNCLAAAGIKRLLDLVTMPEDQVLTIKNFGRRSLQEVEDNLKSLGLSFGMKISPEDMNRILEHAPVGK